MAVIWKPSSLYRNSISYISRMVVAYGQSQPAQEIEGGILVQMLATLVGVRDGILGLGIGSITKMFPEVLKVEYPLPLVVLYHWLRHMCLLWKTLFQ